ncbi:MAG: hypothetical protein OXN83_04345 [Oligoflexia bacterium]|nr:hypothetical protein [Oligoflexia bacterium]
MKRFRDQKIEEIIIDFKEKLSKDKFNKKYYLLKKYSGKISWDERKGGGSIETAYSEISALYQLGAYYKASYLKWTGDQEEGNDHDGVLYINENEKIIEISLLLDEKDITDFRLQGFSERDSIIEDSLEESNQEIIHGMVNLQVFIYNRIVKIFKKKHKDKYKGYWLCIPYNPFSILGEFNESKIQNNIYNKIQREEKNLWFSIRNIFDKIIFLPLEQNDKIFEWIGYK